MGKKKIFWCKNCWNMSTRNRITFDERGWCNACQWMEEKKTFDWDSRQKELDELLNKYRSKDGNFDCITAVSGGKDGSYVSYMLKHKYGMNPLAMTMRPAMTTELGEKNVLNFIDSGYSHIHISANPKAMARVNKYGFIDKGFPYYGWLIAIMSAVIRTAANFEIPLIFYGEDGEVEYGGDAKNKFNALYDINYMKKVYLEGGHEKILNKVRDDGDISEADLSFFKFPKDEKVEDLDMAFTHWSYFEPWDSYRNYVVAKENCGLKENDTANHGTFQNFGQTDQAMFHLHTYLMYLKFGFGRATQDVGIEIRRGSMTRDQGLNLVKMYDNAYPEHLIDDYLEYFEMTKEEFDSVLDKHVNKDLFEKIDGRWEPKYEVGEEFYV